MRTGRPTTPIMLTPTERETLEQWARRRTTAQALAQRARIILASAAGTTGNVVARELRIVPQTVSKWRRRFVHSTRFDRWSF
jgi:FixJ family two-component response regulator